MYFKSNIIITDPMYIIKSDVDWSKCNYGKSLDALNISNYITSEHGDEIGSDIISLDTSEKIGEFCSDSGMVSIMSLNEVQKYNPDFDKDLEPHCYTIIENFDGEIELLDMDEDDGTDQRLYFMGKGNVNFRTDFFDK